MKNLRNEMILASAGSGKTYRLTNRFVHLLALGVSPERIIALTFTRKAAAEFLDEILKKLSTAASNPGFATELRDQLELENFGSPEALKLLRLVIDRLHLLTLGTLDSFFHRILACFPAEFGLGAKFEVLSDHDAIAARARVFASVYANRTTEDEFIEAFKKSTFGSEEKNLQSILDDFVTSHHQTYLRQPNPSRWGRKETIWPGSAPWLEPRSTPEEACRHLRAATAGFHLDKKALAMWEGLLDFLEHLPGAQKSKPSDTTLERFLLAYTKAMRGGPVDLKFNRSPFTLPPDLCASLADLGHHYLAFKINPYLERTQGIHQILRIFEDTYGQQIRRAGMLGFLDIRLLLNGTLLSENWHQELSACGGEGKLHVDYRLDGKFDHWLLDEFQDTSNDQWQVIANLIDEVLQDSGGQRSLFYVGDVKQAIFGWCGGDSALFNDIRNHYNSRRPDCIATEQMQDSRRSGPALMETINRIFGDTATLRSLFPDHEEFLQRWEADWVPHTTHHQDRSDYVELLTLDEDPESEESSKERGFAAVAALVAEIAPHEQNLSCAILVRTNDDALELANTIRARTDVPVTVESDTLIGSDHPIASSFVSLLQSAAHPGDTTAWRHVLMTPAFAAHPCQEYGSLQRRIQRRVLTTIHDSGFGATFALWLDLLAQGGFVPDEFARHRIDQLRQSAEDFDADGNRSIADFIRTIESAASREAPAEGVVQIMTVHKSKGLGFDVVILPDFTAERNVKSITSPGILSLVAHQSGVGLHREIDWVLKMPNKDVCLADPTLLEARQKLENERAYEELCVLYVALTRAKYATHILCVPPKMASDPDATPKGSTREILHTTLKQDSGVGAARTLGEEVLTRVYALGHPDWHHTHRGTRPAPKQETRIPPVHHRRPFPPIPRALPSSGADDAHAEKQGSHFLFSRRSREAANHGTKLHAVFERIDWLDHLTPSTLEETVLTGLDPADPSQSALREEILTALRAPAILALFQRTRFGPDPTLWREKRFEIIHEGSWVSGTFDRVVLTAGEAWILDFKTNRVSTPGEIAAAAESYKSQLAVYRHALSRLTGVAPENIHTHLIFTKPAVLV